MTKNFSYLFGCALLAGTFLSSGVFAGDKDPDAQKSSLPRKSPSDDQQQAGSSGGASGSARASGAANADDDAQETFHHLLTGVISELNLSGNSAKIGKIAAALAPRAKNQSRFEQRLSQVASLLNHGSPENAATGIIISLINNGWDSNVQQPSPTTPAPTPEVTEHVLGGAAATTPSTSATSSTADREKLRLKRLAHLGVSTSEAAVTTPTAGTAVPDAPQPTVYSLEVPAAENAEMLKMLAQERERLWPTGTNAAPISTTTAPMPIGHLSADEQLQLVMDTPGLSSPEADSSGAAGLEDENVALQKAIMLSLQQDSSPSSDEASTAGAAASLNVEGLSEEEQVALAMAMSLQER